LNAIIDKERKVMKVKKNLSVYPQRCKALEELFERAESPLRILIVPLDTAKRTHVARICDGAGGYVYKQPFSVNNTLKGLEFVEARIDKARKKTGVPKDLVVVAMEDPPHYVSNFAYRLADLGYLVVRVNARDASRKRKSARGSSDVTALDGICRMVMDRQAYELGPECNAFAKLKTAARERRRLVRSETAMKNTIHRSVEIVFPGFDKVEGLTMFGAPALMLMRDNFHAGQMARQKVSNLTKKLKRYGERKPETVALAIIAAAKNTVVSKIPQEQVLILKAKVDILQGLQVCIRLQTTVMGRALAETDGIYFTTIPGIGVVLAGQIVAELGMRGLYGDPMLTASYAGIIPGHIQTGGPESPAKIGHLPMDRNSVLKDYLEQAAHHVGKTPMPGVQPFDCHHEHDLMIYFREKEARGEKSLLGTSRKLLRIMRGLARDKAPYQPRNWFATHSELPDFTAIYMENMLTAVERKWKTVGLTMKDDNEIGRFYRSFRKLADDYRSGCNTTLEG
jgi:transposase